MTQRGKLVAFGLIMVLWLPHSAQAAVNCRINTIAVAFGSYDVFSSSVLTSVGSVSIRCVGIGRGTSPVSVSLNPGNSGNFQPRKMLRDSETLNYNLYLDPGGSQIWGDGTSGTQIFSAMTSNNQTLNLPIFGRMPAGQDVSVGIYSDTIIATINF
jgi:spore coat protein U-like protein